jgi:hypothetical protein
MSDLENEFKIGDKLICVKDRDYEGTYWTVISISMSGILICESNECQYKLLFLPQEMVLHSPLMEELI